MSRHCSPATDGHILPPEMGTKGPGRPPLPKRDRKSSRLDVRMLPTLYRRIERAATRAGMTPPEWARAQLERVLDRAAK